MHRIRGFTLIELMVVIAIVALLATFAVPAFTDQLRKSRRSEAVRGLSDLQLRQERWRASHSTYGTLAQLGLTNATPAPGYYSYALTTPTGNCPDVLPAVAATTANSYILTATATGSQSTDSKCATIVLTNSCGTLSKSSTPTSTCW